MTRWNKLASGCLLLALATLPQPSRGEDAPQSPQSPQDDDAQASSESQADVIIVVGAAGEESFGEAFATWAARWQQAAQAAGANLTRIGPAEVPDASTDSEAKIDDTADASAPTDHQRLRQAIAALDADSAAPLWIVMMGHGTFSQNVAKFNLRGPDVAADELAQWLEPITRPLVVVAAFSSSGPFINALSGENRVIVTATRSGTEQNYSRFGDYLSQAIAEEHSDINHDEEVSILEAFLAASAAVRDFYHSQGRIATEHALLDDNGDTLGTPAGAFRGARVAAKASNPDQSPDGAVAAQITLSPAAARLPLTQQQRVERDEIEAELANLRARRDTMTTDEYQAAVLPQLIRLARIYQAAEARAEEPQR